MYAPSVHRTASLSSINPERFNPKELVDKFNLPHAVLQIVRDATCGGIRQYNARFNPKERHK